MVGRLLISRLWISNLPPSCLQISRYLAQTVRIFTNHLFSKLIEAADAISVFSKLKRFVHKSTDFKLLRNTPLLVLNLVPKIILQP